jgi:hypothetical protein
MNSTIEALIKIFEKDLNKLEEEMKLYPDEVSLWKVGPGIKNPGGNLCLHLCGNLQHFFGTVLGQSGYKRNRDYEFSAKDVPISEIIKEIQHSRRAVLSVLDKMRPEDLEKEYPVVVFEKPMTTAYFLVHLAGHLNYHVGQINYHRRLLTAGT